MNIYNKDHKAELCHVNKFVLLPKNNLYIKEAINYEKVEGTTNLKTRELCSLYKCKPRTRKCDSVIARVSVKSDTLQRLQEGALKILH